MAELTEAVKLNRQIGRKLWVATLGVFVVAALLLGYDLGGNGIGAAEIDPIAQVRAQDESVYTHIAQGMAAHGDWLNPKVSGRLWLAKPPLLTWMAAVALTGFDLDQGAARMPVMLLGAAGVGAVFLWAAALRGFWFGTVGALLLLGNSIWVTLARVCYTDVPAGTFTLGAVLVFALGGSMAWVGLLVGLAVLAKSVVGLLPVAAIGAYCVLTRTWPRGWAAGTAIAVCVAAPWHLYQAVMHPQWFAADFLQHQLVKVGVQKATGVADVSWLYGRRLLEMDPVLAVFAAVGLVGLWTQRQKREVLLVVCWVAVCAAALAGFKGRSVSYLPLILPGLCMVAVMGAPRRLGSPIVAGALAALIAVKIGVADQTWSLRLTVPELPGSQAVEWYEAQKRGRELIIAKPDDELSTLTREGMRVRYAFVGARPVMEAMNPHYRKLGVALMVEEWERLDTLRPAYRSLLREWGVDSDEPIGSAILLEQAEDLARVARAWPTADYDVPAGWVGWLWPTVANTHDVRMLKGRAFLLAKP